MMPHLEVKGNLQMEELGRVVWDVSWRPVELGSLRCFRSQDFSYSGQRWMLKITPGLNEDGEPVYDEAFMKDKHRRRALSVELLREASPIEGKVNFTVSWWLNNEEKEQKAPGEFACTYRAGRAACNNGCRQVICYYQKMQPSPFLSSRSVHVIGEKFLLPSITIMVTLKRTRSLTSSDSYDRTLDDMATMAKDMGRLLFTGHDSDLTVEVRGETFRLHRCIVRVRSPIFGAMLSQKMLESLTGVVHIDDCEPDVFRAFVKYVYGGRLDDLCTSSVFGLYAMADEYKVEELRSVCYEFIKDSLSSETFCDVVCLAETYNLTYLMRLATNYLACRTEEVLQSGKWVEFLTQHPERANELMLKSVQKYNETLNQFDFDLSDWGTCSFSPRT